MVEATAIGNGNDIVEIRATAPPAPKSTARLGRRSSSDAIVSARRSLLSDGRKLAGDKGVIVPHHLQSETGNSSATLRASTLLRINRGLMNIMTSVRRFWPDLVPK